MDQNLIVNRCFLQSLDFYKTTILRDHMVNSAFPITIKRFFKAKMKIKTRFVTLVVVTSKIVKKKYCENIENTQVLEN